MAERRRTGTRKPRTTVLVMCEGTSEKVYFDRLARMTDSYAIMTKVSKDKRPCAIIGECAREAERRELFDTDIRVAAFDLDTVEQEDAEGLAA